MSLLQIRAAPSSAAPLHASSVTPPKDLDTGKDARIRCGLCTTKTEGRYGIINRCPTYI
jgi:hypothetical protein